MNETQSKLFQLAIAERNLDDLSLLDPALQAQIDRKRRELERQLQKPKAVKHGLD